MSIKNGEHVDYGGEPKPANALWGLQGHVEPGDFGFPVPVIRDGNRYDPKDTIHAGAEVRFIPQVALDLPQSPAADTSLPN